MVVDEVDDKNALLLRPNNGKTLAESKLCRLAAIKFPHLGCHVAAERQECFSTAAGEGGRVPAGTH